MGRAGTVVHQTSPRKSSVKVFVLTDSPSPYQVEFFNQIVARGLYDLQVGYLRGRDPERQWNPPPLNHDSLMLDSSTAALRESLEAARRADLVVFNYYRDARAEELIELRATQGKPWCFWGERPGLRQPQFAGAWFRKWKLKALRRSHAPIWGIGEFAVARYREEFGKDRAYQNLPYFSDLDRFAVERRSTGSELLFLFVGAVVPRKGIDLVARAFVRLAQEFPHVKLRIAGAGVLEETVARTLQPVRERVEFMGFRHWHELPELYAAADVLCVPSRYDGWGLVVAEGLASGVPVIATDKMGAALEFVRTGKNGWLIPADNGEALFAAMREAAITTASELDHLGQEARRSVSEHTLAHGAERFGRYAREAVNV